MPRSENPSVDTIAERERCAAILIAVITGGCDPEKVRRAFKAVKSGTPADEFKLEP